MIKSRKYLIFVLCVFVSYAVIVFSLRKSISPAIVLTFSIICIIGFSINELVKDLISKIDVLEKDRNKFPAFINKFTTWCLGFSSALFVVGFNIPDLLESISEKEFKPPSRVDPIFILLSITFACLPFFATFIWFVIMHIQKEVKDVRDFKKSKK